MKYILIKRESGKFVSRYIAYNIPKLVTEAMKWLSEGGARNHERTVVVLERRFYIKNKFSGMTYDTKAKTFNKRTWVDNDEIFEHWYLKKIMIERPDKFTGSKIYFNLVDVTLNYSF